MIDTGIDPLAGEHVKLSGSTVYVINNGDIAVFGRRYSEVKGYHEVVLLHCTISGEMMTMQELAKRSVMRSRAYKALGDAGLIP